MGSGLGLLAPDRARSLTAPRWSAGAERAGPGRRGNAGHAGPAPAASRPGPQAVAAGPILVVDDDPALLATVCDILEAEGYPVARAANGAEALEAIERDVPSLVLLDMRMPIVNGWQFADALRTRGISLPVVVMTAAQDAQRWAAEIGALGYLAKPFDLPDLLAIVERFRRTPSS